MSDQFDSDPVLKIGRGGQWKIGRLSGRLPPLVGDGVADDTDAIEARLRAGLRLPPGVYLVSRTIELRDDEVAG